MDRCFAPAMAYSEMSAILGNPYFLSTIPAHGVAVTVNGQDGVQTFWCLTAAQWAENRNAINNTPSLVLRSAKPYKNNNPGW